MSDNSTNSTAIAPAATASSSSESSSPLPYIVIELGKTGNANTIPFNKILARPTDANSKKTPFNTMFYCFLTHLGPTSLPFWKIGQTYDDDTYHSKNRFDPFSVWRGQFQILHYGQIMETLIGHYLDQEVGGPYKGNTEWYCNAVTALGKLRAAMDANELYKAETPRDMKNIETFQCAYTCGLKASIDDYLSLFRVRYKEKLYHLTTANIELRLNLLAAPQFAVVPTTPVVKEIPVVLSDDESKSK
jgi:hypothetical protein